MEEKKIVGLVISKLELDEDLSVYEYMVRMPNRTIEKFRVRTSAINVGNKVQLGEVVNENNEKRFKILKIV